ncbi:MAG TPA: aminodeoxychorismate synthase component I, partial [bacterium]|nr:aminodeoxychorismate synthase component I [bacterium]
YSSLYLFDTLKKKAYFIRRNKKENPLNFGKKTSTAGVSIEENITSNLTRKEYIGRVKKIKEYIRKGDVYEVNFSRRFETRFDGSPFDLWDKVCSANPAPFSGFLDFGEFQILSASPERFIKKTGPLIQTRPIKGTSPLRLNSREALRRSSKEKAELMMIVDLERNDLGKICEYGQVWVERLRAIEKHPTVFHTVSDIRGILKPKLSFSDIMRALFPGGSITGAPKIRSMEIIEELEPSRRNIYCGSIGYIDFNGNFDLNIAIRTLLLRKGRVFYQSGGGIVADSDPEKEYEETLHKIKNLTRALENSSIENRVPAIKEVKNEFSFYRQRTL